MVDDSLNRSLPGLTEKTLAVLIDECQQQVAHYHQQNGQGDSPSCAEIVVRAADGNDDALSALLEMSAPAVRRKCPAQLREDIDDVVQDVNLRLVRKFRNAESPYRPSSYAAFVTYLNLTIRSVTVNRLERGRSQFSLEQMHEESGYEPSAQSHADVVEQRMLLQKILLLLPDPLEREALRRRYTLRETPAEIAEALQAKAPGISKKQVYRLVERGMNRLVNHPEVQEVREGWS